MSFAGSRSVPIIIDSDSDVEQVSPTPNTEGRVAAVQCFRYDHADVNMQKIRCDS